MPALDLLRSLPRSRRDIQARQAARTQEIVTTAKEFGFEYFDGPRSHGYGGYRYDGRWQPVAHDIISHYQLKPGQRVLDIGCAKGFLVKDLRAACPGLEVFGLDISRYALMHCETETIGYLHHGTALDLPFPDNSFDLAISINVVHNFDRPGVLTALREMQRVSPRANFVQVDSYRTPEERALFEQWVLTALYHDYPSGWEQVFAEAGYTHDYWWTIAE
jgi:ubiquinone/menaquinone biosynthesis C-methylase UbiE